jgi:hypothetical protein
MTCCDIELLYDVWEQNVETLRFYIDRQRATWHRSVVAHLKLRYRSGEAKRRGQ